MAYRSSRDAQFLATLQSWFESSAELLVLIRYSHAAGSRDFEFHSSFHALAERLSALPPRACVTAFKEPQLPIRGVVDDALVERCIRSIPDGSEYLIVETVRRVHGKASWFHHDAGDAHACLRQDLEESRGVSAAVGLYPPWLVDTDAVISAVVPEESGVVAIGVY